MAEPKFYIIPITKNGAEYTIGNRIDIESTYKTTNAELRYISMDGLEAYGKPRPYVENFAENDMAFVELPTTPPDYAPRDQTDITLTILFQFGGEASETDKIKATSDLYHKFVDEVADSFVLYFDNVRKRKVLMYQSDKIAPKTDSLKSGVYKTVEIKFKNVFGRSFPIDSISAIETALGVDHNLTNLNDTQI